PNSRMRTNRHGLNVLLVRLEDAIRYRAAEGSNGEPAAAVKRFAQELLAALTEAAQAGTATFCVGVCPSSSAELRQIEQEVLHAARQLASVFDAEQLQALYPVPALHDPERDQLAHIPYTDPFYRALATLIARRAFQATGPQFKVLILDCDEVLWGGV